MAWLVLGVLWGAQTSLGSSVMGDTPLPLLGAIVGALQQILPWVPVTLAVIVLAVRFPFSRERWARYATVHLVAAALLAFVANVLVVLMYWATTGKFGGLVVLAQQGAIWATVRFHIALTIYASILGVTQGVLYYRRTQSRELQLAKMEGQLAQARLQALNAQIRPHFLFNTLHTIGQLWRTGRSDDADAVLDHLGALFHKVSSSTSRYEVPLAEELELVRDYLAIEEVRFRDRLRPTVAAPANTLDCLVPPLILQPLVENAVRHGISAVSTAGVLEVSAAREGSRLRLTVRDDGPGLSAGTKSPGSGTGLRNTRERLAQLYGDRGLMSIAEAPGGGTIVTVDIPVLPNGSANGNGHAVASANGNGSD
ncbi:MAG TPA: histidine kinase [Gemmatimonadaceae bacterium]|nr:histidine kinase [Gemmatimonadaceae bacterium]